VVGCLKVGLLCRLLAVSGCTSAGRVRLASALVVEQTLGYLNIFQLLDVLYLLLELEDLFDVEHKLFHHGVVSGVQGEHAPGRLELKNILARFIGTSINLVRRVKDVHLLEVDVPLRVFERHRHDVARDALQVADGGGVAGAREACLVFGVRKH